MGFEYLDTEKLPLQERCPSRKPNFWDLPGFWEGRRKAERWAQASHVFWLLLGALDPSAVYVSTQEHYTAVAISCCHIGHLQMASEFSEGANCLPGITDIWGF